MILRMMSETSVSAFCTTRVFFVCTARLLCMDSTMRTIRPLCMDITMRTIRAPRCKVDPAPTNELGTTPRASDARAAHEEASSRTDLSPNSCNHLSAGASSRKPHGSSSWLRLPVIHPPGRPFPCGPAASPYTIELNSPMCSAALAKRSCSPIHSRSFSVFGTLRSVTQTAHRPCLGSKQLTCALVPGPRKFWT